ncbi:MAG TPA: Ig-like domain-containing protein, partial [Myxococcus sp.]|nr:Ig-like domain-containing protein [Myxococcus sp.]
ADAGSPGTDAGTPETDGGSQAPAPTLVLEAPADGTVVGGMRFAVLGRVEGGVLPVQVTVNGISAAVTSRDFSASLALLEGPRTVSVAVRDALGRTATAQRSVVVDRTAPFIEITRPVANPAQVTESPYLLQGTVGDANLASVTVRGEPVAVVAGSFSVPVALSAGDNAIAVDAVDLAGNRRSVVQHLVIESVPPAVTILQPLDGTEAESAIIEVRAQVTGGTGELDVRIGTGAATRVSPGLYTAQVPLGLGQNVIPVTATDAQGLSGSAQVTVRYRDVTREPLAVTGVQPAPGAVEVETDALVSVAFNKPVRPEDVDSRFQVWARGARLQGGYSVAPGAQTVTFVAGSPLPAGERVTVRVSGMRAAAGPGMDSAFASEFTVRQALTVVRGVVMDERLQPLAGVKVEVEGQELSTRTGPDGNWALLDVAGGGPVVLRYEGGTTQDGRTLPAVRRQLFVTSGQETVDRPLALIPVDGASARAVDGATGGTITFPNPHGPMKLEVEEGGLAFMDGSTRGFLTVTEVAPYLRPVPIEDRVSVDALWQLGPERVQFLRQPRLTLPNRTKLPAGRMVVLLGYDSRRLALSRVGLGRVAADGGAIVSEGPVGASSLEFFGYMALTPEMQVKLEEALAQGGMGAPADGGTGLDGGLGLRLEPRRPPFWQRVAETVLGTAHAQLAPSLPFLWAMLDRFPGGVAFVKGQVRAPRERQTTLSLALPQLRVEDVRLPHNLPIDFKATYDTSLGGSESVTSTVSAVGPNGSNIAPPDPDEPWEGSGTNEVTLTTQVPLEVGTTTVTLSGRTRYDTRSIRLKVSLEPIVTDAGSGERWGRLTVQQEADSSDGSEPFDGVVRFGNMPVSITSYMDSGGVTNERGQYSALVYVPAADTAGVACADVPLGPRYSARIDGAGNTRFSPVNGTFPVCSSSFLMYPEAFSYANIYVDMRLLYGNLTFRNKDGRPVPAPCEGGQTQRDASTGELSSISEKDVATTEVHFFREDNLEQPIARYAVTRPLARECEDPENPPLGAHGMYSRIRMGPSSSSQMTSIRNRCSGLKLRLGSLNPEEEAFHKAECGPSGRAFLRLSPGDRLVVFAVNHATGYAGMGTVTVPSINQDRRAPDGTCPADVAAGGPLEVAEGGRTYKVSRCTEQELGIPGNVDLYPPEIDVRVKRRAEAEGIQQPTSNHLIRTGGAGTTRDEYVQVTTHWRVRRAPPSMDGGTADGGVPGGGDDEDCDKGFLPDGGICRPSSITDDDADAGRPLEIFCSELSAGAAAKYWAVCLRDNMELSDVPKGAPPLKGQIVRVTGGMLEEPA